METKKWRTIRIGTRKSRLALVQTKMVAEAIQAVCPEVVCELVPAEKARLSRSLSRDC